MTGDEFALIHLSLEEAVVLVHRRVLCSSSCDELKNFAVNIFLKLVIKSCNGIRVSIG